MLPLRGILGLVLVLALSASYAREPSGAKYARPDASGPGCLTRCAASPPLFSEACGRRFSEIQGSKLPALPRSYTNRAGIEPHLTLRHSPIAMFASRI
jgi:hypothetical protein